MSAQAQPRQFINEAEFRRICRENGYDGQLVIDLGRKFADDIRDVISHAAHLYLAHGMAPAEQATTMQIGAVAFANDYGAHSARFVKDDCREDFILKAVTDYEGGLREGFARHDKLVAELAQKEESNMSP